MFFAAALFNFSWQMAAFSLFGWIFFGKIGGEIGLHRYFAHQSFKTNTFFARSFLILGSLNCIGSPLAWTGIHRAHHKNSDGPGDPHGGQSIFVIWFAFWNPTSIPARSIVDLIRDPWQKFLHEYYFEFLFLVFFTLALVDYWLPIYLISIPAVITFHSAGMVNSICHRFGYRNFESLDKSYNNIWVNFVTLGSGLHNNHHARPSSFSNSVRWFEFDFPGWMISRFFLRE